MNTINTVKKQISALELEVAKLENVIVQVNYEIGKIEYKTESLQAEISGFEFTCSSNEFDEYLDECCEPVKVFGMEFYPSDVLKNCDPTAYRCAKSDYEGTKDFEDVPAYVELTEKLEDLETDLGDHESDLESLQSELEDLRIELEELQSELDELNMETNNTSKMLYVIIDGEEILVNKNVSCVDASEDQLNVIDVDYIEDVQTVVVTLEDERTVQVQFEKETNRLHADYGTYSAHIDKCNEYGLDLSEHEESLFNDWIDTSEVIQDVLNELNNI